MRVQFTRLADGTAEEFRQLEEFDRTLDKAQVPHLLSLFRATDRDNGYPLTPMLHALQTATRALADGADDELVVAALFHDIGDCIAPSSHAAVAAGILRPFVSEGVAWVVERHAEFQGYYYWHHVGRNRQAREVYRGHPHFEACVKFCERWDQESFDPAYDTLPLETFLPAVERIFSREPYGSWRK